MGTRTLKDGHLSERRAIMEKTGTYGKDGSYGEKRAHAVSIILNILSVYMNQ
jgi:hypothetical protein